MSINAGVSERKSGERRALALWAEKEAALARAIVSEPCFACGVTYANHAETGCGKWWRRP